MKTVVAVDVGAGNTNVIAAKDGQVFSSFMFPSGVGLDAHGALSSFHRGLERKYEVCPKIDGTIFRVSLRPNQQVPDYSRGMPNENYQASKHHAALLAAAIHATRLEQIDMLVVGTPVHTFHQHADELRKLKGELDYGLDRRFEIRNVLVLPQPYGSLLAAINQRILERGDDVNHCVIDIGYFTSDILKTKSLFINDSKSFGTPFGVAAVYQKIADMLAAELRKPIKDLDRIDYSVRTATPYRAHGQSIDLNSEGYLQRVQPYIEAHVGEFYGRLGTTEDITSVLLTGGGCTLFESAVRKVFHSTTVRMMPDAMHANVRGYLIAGQSAL